MPRLGPDLADYLDLGLAFQVGACDPAGQPFVVRALGILIEPDHRLSVLLSSAANPELLGVVSATRQVSVVLCQPTTLRTMQFKGADAEVHVAESAGYRDALERGRDSFWCDIESLGFAREQLASWYEVAEGELARITFTPYGAWNQTPGPGAGKPVELLP